ncbi:MAG: hypothetical protein K2G13_04565 [Muribaculaceae bacterium]|nr:hypothetical protein [Muribaculaceae bacterium]
MKFLFRSVYTLGAILLLIALGACSEKDDQDISKIPDLPTPAFENSSAKYVMDENSPYRSIEFTASGNYLIVTDEAYQYYALASCSSKSAQLLNQNVFKFSNELKTRTYFDGLYFGTYTLTGDNQYNLSAFGTITVNSDESGNAYSLTVTPANGTSQTFTASRVSTNKDSSRTNALCRTWDIVNLHVKITENGKKIFDKTLSIEEYKDIFEDDDDEFEEPKQIIFTKSGTYMVLYKDSYNNNRLDISTWIWENEDQGILRYSWNLDNIYDPYDSGLVNTTFSGKNLVISETHEDDEDGIRIRTTIEFNLTESK